MTAEQTISERIEAVARDVLRGHAWMPGSKHPAFGSCACDRHLRLPKAEHRVHVAKETAAALLAAGVLQEVRAEALRGAADEYGTPGMSATTGYVQEWLRDRADSIAQGRRDGGGVS